MCKSTCTCMYADSHCCIYPLSFPNIGTSAALTSRIFTSISPKTFRYIIFGAFALSFILIQTYTHKQLYQTFINFAAVSIACLVFHLEELNLSSTTTNKMSRRWRNYVLLFFWLCIFARLRWTLVYQWELTHSSCFVCPAFTLHIDPNLGSIVRWTRPAQQKISNNNNKSKFGTLHQPAVLGHVQREGKRWSVELLEISLGISKKR